MLEFMNTRKGVDVQPRTSANFTSTPSKKLGWMIENPPEAPVRMVIDPALATRMLEYNTNNRPASQGKVKQYAADMERGRWKETFECIQFSPDRLIQGQHRLMACVQSGVAFPAWVAFGADDDTFDVIDTGKTRTSSDIFAINGVKNAVYMAAATKFVFAYQEDIAIGNGFASKRLSTPAQSYEYFQSLDTERMQRGISAASWFAESRVPTPSAALAAFYCCSQKNEQQARDFFEKVGTGLGFKSKREVEYRLRETLTDRNEKHKHRDYFAFLLIGWNAVRRNRTTATFSFNGGKYPRAQ